jgi:dethiobiotin synthetase
MPHLFISAAHKSSGKTTVSIGLCAALRARGRVVQPFKKGPDYIDPLWLSQAAGRPCFNLDFYTMARAEIEQTFRERMHGAQLGLVEGNKGLYDGLDLDGSNSNAALAALLGAPVVLVLDTRGMTRGVAPLLLGYQAFDPQIRIAGVILNHVGGARHEGKLRQVIEHYTDVRVVGAVARSRELEIVERHLGLMPSNESREAAQQIERLGACIDRSPVRAGARGAHRHRAGRGLRLLLPGRSRGPATGGRRARPVRHPSRSGAAGGRRAVHRWRVPRGAHGAAGGQCRDARGGRALHRRRWPRLRGVRRPHVPGALARLARQSL